MRIVAVSDLHGHLPTIEPCDLLILAGDYESTRSVEREHVWYEERFLPWLHRAPARHTVVVAGNHDQLIWGFGRKLFNHPGVHYLCDESVTLEGVKIYGFPWTPPFYHWFFMASEEAIRRKLDAMPTDVDIVVSHGPPKFACDRTLEGDAAGSWGLREAVLRVRPMMVICGHIHEARGETDMDGVRVCNVSHVNRGYAPVHSPVVFDIDF